VRRQIAQIVPAHRENVKGVKLHFVVVFARVRCIEIRGPVHTQHHGLAIDHELSLPDLKIEIARFVYESNQARNKRPFPALLVRSDDPTAGHLFKEDRAVDDGARLDDCIFALSRRLEELASKVSELQNLRDRVAKAEQSFSVVWHAKPRRRSMRQPRGRPATR
jgi:hypothetical protein